MAFADTGRVGIEFGEVLAGTGTSNDQGNEFALGTRATAKDGQEYMYVHAATAVTQFDWLGVDENFEASAGTKAMADDGQFIMFAQIAAANNDFFWAAVQGSNINVRVAGSCAADVSLYTTSTAGVLDDTSASQTKIQGITAVAANATTSATNTEIIAISPHVDLPA